MNFKRSLQRLAKTEPDAADAIEEFIDGVQQNRDHLSTRLQRAEELLLEVRNEIDYRYDDEPELTQYKERIDAFLGGRNDD